MFQKWLILSLLKNMLKMKNNLNVAIVQFSPKFGQIMENVALAIEILKDIKLQNLSVDFVVFPEMSLFGYQSFEKLDKTMLEVMQKGLDVLSAAISELQLPVVIGYFRQKNQMFYNSVGIFDARGKLRNVYDKIHLVEGIEASFASGNQGCIININDFNIGLAICWDLAFSEHFETLYRDSLDCYIVCSAWEQPFQNEWEILLKARAIESGKMIIGVNQSVKGTNLIHFGHSMAVNPKGEITCQLPLNDYQTSWKVITISKVQSKLGRGFPFKEQNLREKYPVIVVKI